MPHLRVVALGLSLWLGASLAPLPEAFAQVRPALGTRMPLGGSLGAPARPPRLTLPSDPGRPGDHPHPPFFPYWPYFPYGYYDYYDYYDSDDYFPDSAGYRPADSAGEGYSDAYPPETQPVPVQAAREVYPVYDTIAAVGPLLVSSTVVGSRTRVRLTWRDHGLGAKQVAFFLADSSRAVLTAETVRSPPFTALLEPPPGTAYAAMTVVLPGGALETQYVPHKARAK